MSDEIFSHVTQTIRFAFLSLVTIQTSELLIGPLTVQVKQLSYDCLGDLGCTREPRGNRGVHVFERTLPAQAFDIFFEKKAFKMF